MIKLLDKKLIELYDWNELVCKTYGRTYNLQQQDGCQHRGLISLRIPDKSYDDEMNDSIPEKVNGNEMGVKFKKWLERDPELPIKNQRFSWELNLFWERNFYPELQAVANDMYDKGLIEEGYYSINIDW